MNAFAAQSITRERLIVRAHHKVDVFSCASESTAVIKTDCSSSQDGDALEFRIHATNEPLLAKPDKAKRW